MQLFGLVIFTKKELMALLIDEKRFSYRKGYKAGAAMRYRHEKKPEVFIDEARSITDKQMEILKSKEEYKVRGGPGDWAGPFIYNPDGSLISDHPETNAYLPNPTIPSTYGDSLPVKPMPEAVVHTEEPIQGC